MIELTIVFLGLGQIATVLYVWSSGRRNLMLHRISAEIHEKTGLMLEALERKEELKRKIKKTNPKK